VKTNEIRLSKKLNNKMFKKIKLLLFLHKIYNTLMKIKFIKALMALISVLMSYKIIKFLWYFNKAIIYVLGLIFVGFNWTDYRLFTEIKLIYDSLILWGMSFFPKNPVAYDLKNKTEKDIKEILLKDKEAVRKLNKEGIVTDYRPYHISDNLENVKKARKQINQSYISDGINDWSISDLIKDPVLLGSVVLLILAAGTIIVYKYDIDVMEWTQWSWSHIKSGFFAILAFIWKLIQWFNGRGGGNPPAIGDRVPRRGPSRNIPEINEPGPSNRSLVKYGEGYIEKFINGLNKDHEEFNRIYNDLQPDIDKLSVEILRIKDLPHTKENYINLADNYKRLFTLYQKLPMQDGFINPMKGKSVMVSSDIEDITPKASTSFNIDEIPLIADFNIPKEPIIPFVSSPQPMSSVELDVSPGKIVNNMTTYLGLSVNEISSTLTKFLRYELNSIHEFDSYLKFRAACFDTNNENFDEIYNNHRDAIKLLKNEMARLVAIPADPSVLSDRKDCLMRFEQIYSQIPHKPHLSLIDAVDTYNMTTYPDKYNIPNQPVYDIDALDRYYDRLENNLDEEVEAFDIAVDLHGVDLSEICNEIDRLKLLPKNSVTNKEIYKMYMKCFDILYKYPIEESVESLDKSPFIKPKTSELLSIENIMSEE
jgi:hypothetical protein